MAAMSATAATKSPSSSSTALYTPVLPADSPPTRALATAVVIPRLFACSSSALPSASPPASVSSTGWRCKRANPSATLRPTPPKLCSTWPGVLLAIVRLQPAAGRAVRSTTAPPTTTGCLPL